jgi:hypothetical protein
LEIHNDNNRYFNLFSVAEDAGVLEEVKSLLDDYIRFMKENRGVEKIKIPKIDYSTPSL